MPMLSTMEIHLVIKFQYFAWNRDDKNLVTISEHEKIISKHGKVYWGRVSAIAPSKIEELNAQVSEGKKTYVFLYATEVPKSIHADGNLWFIAELESVYPGTPIDKHLVPEYYRDSVKLEVSFLLKNIKQLNFDAGQTPKVPGQAAIRYCVIKGSPAPKNLFTLANPEVKLVHSGKTETPVIEVPQTTTIVAGSSDLRDELLQAKSEIIDLQNEIINLREYRELYRKILDTDYLFSSEKFLETWLQENIHRVMPELEIIDQQPTATWPDGQFGRLDLIAKNKETKDIAIIEVKTRKRRIKSGYDQFLRYTSWVRRFKNDISTKYKTHDLKITDAPSFIIITDYTTNEMEAICRDHGITLIKVFGGLGFEKVA